MISNLSATSKIKVSNLDIDKNDTYFKLEDLEITPSLVEQKFKSKKYGYDNVTVKAVETEELNIIPSTETQINDGLFNKVTVAGDENLIPSNIKKGVNIFGVNGEVSEINGEINDCEYLFKGPRIMLYDSLAPICKNITKANFMFASAYVPIGDSIDKPIDLSILDFSNVTSMEETFSGCNFNGNVFDANSLNKIDTNKVTNMAGTFSSANFPDNFELKIDTSNVTRMYEMFHSSNFGNGFKLNIDTSNVTAMNSMFGMATGMRHRCSEIDLSNLVGTKVTTINAMFFSWKSITKLKFMDFSTTQCNSMGQFFENCSALIDLDLNNFDMSYIKSGVNTAFKNCTALTNFSGFKNLGKGYTQKSNNYTYYKLDLSSCTSLTHDSLVDIMINGLYDLNLTYNVPNGGTLYTQSLVLGSTNLAKLSPEEIAIATNKGWTVS